MAKHLPYFFQNSLGYYYFRYVLPRGLPSFFTENGKYKEIKVSFRTKNRKVAIEKYQYTKRFILNQINSEDFKMSYLELLETAKEKIFNRYSDHIKGAKNDLQKHEIMSEHATAHLESKRQDTLNFKDTTSAIGVKVDELIRNFSSEKIYSKVWREKTRLEHQFTYDRFFKRLKINFASDVTIEKLRSHKDWLIENKLTPQTVNKNLARIDCLMKWAVSQGYIENLQTSATIRVQCKGKTDQDRQALSADTLKKIFHSDFYTAPKNEYTFDYSYQYWIPLIALYSGMRLTEICQLFCEDIVDLDGSVYFDVNSNGPNKALKNKSSKRLVPIHPVLIEFGFLDLVRIQRALNKKVIFSDLNPQRDGYGHYASKWYNGRFKKKIGITKRFEDFHAFRHTFTTKARESGYPIEDIQGILGHSNETITGGTYGKTANLKSRHLEVVRNIQYDLELNKIMPFTEYPFRNGRCKKGFNKA